MVRSRQKTKVEELCSLLDSYSGKTLDVICRGAPDPDFIGSARAFQEIAALNNVAVRYLSTAPVGHAQNREELTLIDMGIQVFGSSTDLSHCEGYVVLDSSDIDKRVVKALNGASWVALVDHHDPYFFNGARPRFMDVRQDVGSTCTIFASYLLEKGMVDASPKGILLATILNFGIQIDTDQFRSATSEDYLMMAQLSRFSDREALNSLMYQSTPRGFMDTYFEAWNRKLPVDQYVLASVSELSADDRDAMAFAAQQMIKVKGIDTAIVYAMVNDPNNGITVQGSLRTCDKRVRPKKLLDTLFPDIQDLGGDCGGRSSMGGFKIPLDSFEILAGIPLASKSAKWEYAQGEIRSRFSQARGYRFTNLCDCSRKKC